MYLLDNYKKNVSIICLSPNFGGMEIDAIKLANKLSSYSKIILVAKENGFIAQKFDNNCLNNQNISLETVKFKSSLSFNIIKIARDIVIRNNMIGITSIHHISVDVIALLRLKTKHLRPQQWRNNLYTSLFIIAHSGKRKGEPF